MKHMRNSGLIGLVLLTYLPAQTRQPAVGQVPPAGASKTDEQPKFKAIWEPVNFHKDLELNDVAFVSALEGWVVGDKETILHTKDGGKNWEAQMGGDPGSTDRPLNQISFVDATHGWARGSAERLLRTADGSAWQDVGALSQHWRSMSFVSPETGFIGDDFVEGG